MAALYSGPVVSLAMVESPPLRHVWPFCLWLQQPKYRISFREAKTIIKLTYRHPVPESWSIQSNAVSATSNRPSRATPRCGNGVSAYWRVCRVVLTSMPGGSDKYAGWYWRACRVVLTSMPGGTDEYAGWYWRVCRVILTSMPGDVDECVEWYWRVCRVVLTCMLGDTDVYAGWYWRVCRVVLTCMPGGTDEHAGWYWRVCRVILTSMPGGTDEYAGWYWRVCRVVLTSMPGDTSMPGARTALTGWLENLSWLPTRSPQISVLTGSPTTLAALTRLPVSITH